MGKGVAAARYGVVVVGSQAMWFGTANSAIRDRANIPRRVPQVELEHGSKIYHTGCMPVAFLYAKLKTEV